MAEQRHFGVWDYVVFSLMLLVSAAIGVFYGCRGSKQKTTKEFLLANRSLSTVPVAISILVSFMSAITILGIPAEMYTEGTQYFLYLFGVSIGAVIAALVFVPLLYPLKLTSSYEYLELRFKSRWAKLTGTLILIVQQVLYMGIASFAPSTALEAVTGFPVWMTIIIIGVVSTFYTTLGGIKAVVWSDVFQSVVMMAGLLAIVAEGVLRVGGMDSVWRINSDWGRISFLDLNPDPTQRHTLWSLVAGGMVGWSAVFGCNQASVQRYCALPSLRKAKISVLLNIPGMAILITVSCLAGVVIFAYYAQQGCDPLTDRQVGNPNQIIPYFAMEVLRFPGLPGLFISCLFSGALSSVSSSLNALAALMWQDFLHPFLGHRLSEGQKTLVTKLMVPCFGAAGIAVAFMVKGFGGTVLQASLSFTGAAGGPILGLFLLGGLFPWANRYGAIVGGLLGLILPFWISVGAYSIPRRPFSLPFPTDSCVSPNISMSAVTMTTADNVTLGDVLSNTTVAPFEELSGVEVLYTLSYLWYPPIGAATVVIVGLIVSFITGPMSTDEIDPKYLIPLSGRLLCCLSTSRRRALRDKKESPKPEEFRASENADALDGEFLLPAKEQQVFQDGRRLRDSGRGSDAIAANMSDRTAV